jgi:hypothetical protein
MVSTLTGRRWTRSSFSAGAIRPGCDRGAIAECRMQTRPGQHLRRLAAVARCGVDPRVDPAWSRVHQDHGAPLRPVGEGATGTARSGRAPVTYSYSSTKGHSPSRSTIFFPSSLPSTITPSLPVLVGPTGEPSRPQSGPAGASCWAPRSSLSRLHLLFPVTNPARLSRDEFNPASWSSGRSPRARSRRRPSRASHSPRTETSRSCASYQRTQDLRS